MDEVSGSQGDRIRALFEKATDGVTIIAPFIKVDALRSLLKVIPSHAHIRCVTRWFPQEVAAGVSDPEIFEELEERGNSNLSLVDRLHAKLFIVGERCLAGSANVTLAGLGEGVDRNNIEVLVETTTADPGISATLNEISQAERPATTLLADNVRRLADSITGETTSEIDRNALWFPRSRRPEEAHRFYTQPPKKHVRAVDRILLADLARCNVSPGLEEQEFRTLIRSLLAAIPIARILLDATEDMMLTRADSHSFLETVGGDEFSTNDLWLAFVNWMVHFFPDQVIKQEIAEVALRRAHPLR